MLYSVCYDAGVRVKVLFFGQLKDITGRAEELLDLPEGASLATVFNYYQQSFPRLAGLAKSIVIARNHQFAALSTTVENNDEIALLPPVSGGAPRYSHYVKHDAGHVCALTREPIDTSFFREELLRPEDGAMVAFDGVVRNNTKGRATRYLEYECYEAMAIRVMQEISAEIASTHEVGRIGMIHRLGRLEIGETSVLVIATAPHRRPAFEAALEGINRLKKLVPIWKKEFFADGEVWVDGEWDDSVISR